MLVITDVMCYYVHTMPGPQEALPSIEREPNYDTVEDGHKNSAAEFGWTLVSLVQKGRVAGATPIDVKRSEDAFAELYSQHYDTINTSILKRVDYDAELAADLTSETFLRAFKGIDSLEWRGKNVSSWLRTIAIRLVLDYYKQPSRLTYAPDDTINHWADESDLGSPEEFVVADLNLRYQWQAIREALEHLKPEQQEVITWHYLQGLSFPEMARRTGREVTALKSLAWRGVQLLKAYIKEAERQARPNGAARTQSVAAITQDQEQPNEDEQHLPEQHITDEPYSNWRALTTLSDQAWQRPQDAYWRALAHPLLATGQIEEHMMYVALGKEAQSQLDSQDLLDDERQDLQAAVRRGNESRQFVATHYLRFALRIALRYANAPDFEDIIQEANAGLIKGVDRYNPYYGREDDKPHADIQPFTTKGSYSVNGAILRYLRNERRHRRLHTAPRASDRNLLLRSYEELRRHDPDITYEQAGEGLGLSKTAVRELLLGKISVHTAVVVDVELNPETTADPASMEPFEHIENDGMTVDEFWAFVEKNVTENELRALREYYVNNKSQEAIAAEMGFASRSWVGELLDHAHTRLRKAASGQDPFERKRRGIGKRKNGPRTFFNKLGVPVPEDADPQELRTRLATILDALQLTPREVQIMRLRYGVDTADGQETSQVDTAKQLELSRGYISTVDPKVQLLAKKYLGLIET
jgi:RNA polymerase sigma-70 factor (ECF subfamily)